MPIMVVFSVIRVVPRILPLEFFHAPGRINELLPTGEKWMALGTDSNAEIRDC